MDGVGEPWADVTCLGRRGSRTDETQQQEPLGVGGLGSRRDQRLGMLPSSPAARNLTPAPSHTHTPPRPSQGRTKRARHVLLRWILDSLDGAAAAPATRARALKALGEAVRVEPGLLGTPTVRAAVEAALTVRTYAECGGRRAGVAEEGGRRGEL